MKKLLLIGGGGHCRSCIDVIESMATFSIFGIVDTPSKLGETVLGYPIVGSDTHISELIKHVGAICITVGQIKSSAKRESLYRQFKALGIEIPTIIAQTAHVSRHAHIDCGSQIFHMTVINSNSQIGQNTIINTGTIIEHDVRIGSHTHISTGCRINGNAIVGDHCFIGSGTCVFEGVKIGNNTIIGAGSLVTKSILEPGVYFGNPARLRSEG